MKRTALVLAAGLTGFSVGAAAQVPRSKAAPGFRLKTAAGQPLALSSLRGKVVLLDFWGPS